MAQPHRDPAPVLSWGGGSQSHPSPAPPHKLQSVPWEHGSSQGVDGFGGFKLVPGSWKKENKPAETWQGTRLHPGPEGDNSPMATRTRSLAARGGGHSEEEEGARLSPVLQQGEAMAGSPCTPTSSIPRCAACFPKQAEGISSSPSGCPGSAPPPCQHRDEPLLPAWPSHRHRDMQRDKILQHPCS